MQHAAATADEIAAASGCAASAAAMSRVLHGVLYLGGVHERNGGPTTRVCLWRRATPVTKAAPRAAPLRRQSTGPTRASAPAKETRTSVDGAVHGGSRLSAMTATVLVAQQCKHHGATFDPSARAQNARSFSRGSFMLVASNALVQVAPRTAVVASGGVELVGRGAICEREVIRLVRGHAACVVLAESGIGCIAKSKVPAAPNMHLDNLHS